MFRKFLALALSIALSAFALQAAAAVEANKASQAELETVKGIGPGLSTKILDARKSGQFKDWNDMVERVSGIGPGNAARFSQAGLTVSGGSYDKSAAASDKPARASRSSRTNEKMTDGEKPARKAKAQQPSA